MNRRNELHYIEDGQVCIHTCTHKLVLITVHRLYRQIDRWRLPHKLCNTMADLLLLLDALANLMRERLFRDWAVFLLRVTTGSLVISGCQGIFSLIYVLLWSLSSHHGQAKLIPFHLSLQVLCIIGFLATGSVQREIGARSVHSPMSIKA